MLANRVGKVTYQCLNGIRIKFGSHHDRKYLGKGEGYLYRIAQDLLDLPMIIIIIMSNISMNYS